MSIPAAAYRASAIKRCEDALLSLIQRPWLLSAILCIPVYIIYASNFIFLPPGVHGTGFVQYDQPYYMANARAYFSDGIFTLTYGLPFSIDPATPKIYFQPLTFALGLILYLTNADPGYLYMAAGIAIAIGCGRVIIACFREVVPQNDLPALVGLICFFWGGGLLALSGIGYGVLTRQPISETWYTFEPFSGWWFLNLGRNLIYTTEALYHLVALGALTCLFRRNYLGTFILAAVLSISHPFSGIEWILILGGAAFVELFFGTARPPRYLFLGLAVLGVLHLFYYLYFLDHASLDHRLMAPQWRGTGGVNQPIPWMTTVLSQILVVPFAVAALARSWRSQGNFSYQQRILLVMWLTVFALSHHDWFISPTQPMHFLRGYDWIALFLIGAPILVEWLRRLAGLRGGSAAIAAVMLVFLFDNASFVAAQATIPLRKGNSFGYVVSDAQRAVFEKLRDPQLRNCIVLSNDETMSYLAVTYTPLRAYYPRDAVTPDETKRMSEQAAFFDRGIDPPLLVQRCGIAIVSIAQANVILPRVSPLGYETVFKNGGYTILHRPADARSSGEPSVGGAQ